MSNLGVTVLNAIGWYQRMMDSIYVDTRHRRVRAQYRYAAKTQYDEFDELVTRYGNDSDGFISAVLRDQLADQIVGITEKIARDGILDNCLHRFIPNGNAWLLGTNDFSSINAAEASAFTVKRLEDIALRMS